MRPLSIAFLTSASFAALAIAAPASAQTPDPVNPGRDPCQAPAGQQDPNAECPPADSPAGEAISQGEVLTQPSDGIVVVGSRIRRDRFNTADPVTIINRDAAVDSGFTSTAEILQNVGVTGGTAQINDTFGGFVVEGGPGVNTLSLRGLGATRTLILLNGRRVSPSGTRGQVGATDLNVLPNALVDRIEILNTGASSIYGSDAVAGVVNIVTRNKYDGLGVEANISIPEIGAGTEKRYAVTFGKSGERFSILGSIEMYDRNRLTLGDMPWARCPTTRYRGPLGSPTGDFIDQATGKAKCFPLDEGGVSINTVGTGFTFIDNADFAGSLAPGMVNEVPTAAPGDPAYGIYCYRWRPNASATTPGMPGFECVTGLIYQYFGDIDPGPGFTPDPRNNGFASSLEYRDTFSAATLQQDFISPARNYTGYLSGTYDTDFFGDGQLYSELLVTRRKSQQNGQLQLTIDYPRFAVDEDGNTINNPLVPAQFFSGARRLSNTVQVRAFTDFGIYDSHQTSDFVKFSGGFRGDLPFLPSWRYDFYGAKSWADGTYVFDAKLRDRLAQSLDVIQLDDGSIVCASAAPNCVPAPAMTSGIIGGNARTLAPDWFDYVTEAVVGTTSFRETTANATFDGPLFTLPGGTAKAVVGFEYRKQKLNDVPSPDSQEGNLDGFTSATITRGTDSVWEAFTELEFPILRNVPFAEELTFNVSGRYTDYESYGSDTTYKVGGIYSPTRWMSFRGSYGTSYRAPALFEQFLAETTGFQPGSQDPCDALSAANTPVPVFNRCTTVDSLAPGFQNNSSITVIQRGGAATGLAAETSKNLTFGGVLQPTFGADFGNLSLAVDYVRVEVNNGVSQLSHLTILDGCYQGTNPEFCQFITRSDNASGTGQDLQVTTGYINVATDIAKGIDFVLRYDRDLGPGRLDIGAQAVYMIDRIFQGLPSAAPFHQDGMIGNPKWAGTGHVGYKTGPWYLRWGVEYIKGTSDNEQALDTDEDGIVDFDPAQFDFSVPDYWLHTLSARYETQRYSLTAGIRNVFDKNPLKISSTDPFVNTTSNVPLQSGFDPFGRTFFINAQAKIF
jgi:outer membrane receptor protein involved in Fe transport